MTSKIVVAAFVAVASVNAVLNFAGAGSAKPPQQQEQGQ